MKNLGVIDLGSNSINLIVNTIDENNNLKTIVADKAAARLSEGMGPEQELKEPAIKRALKTLKQFKSEIKDIPNLKLRIVATAAVRVAKNKQKFCSLIKEKTGFDIEVISGTTEAYYDYLGVISSLPINNCVIIDTGGASIELILVQNRHANHLLSIPFGAVSLTEKFIHSDKISSNDLFSLFNELNNLYNDIWWLKSGKNLPIVALGGSNRTLAKIQRRKDQLRRYWDDIHGFRMSDDKANKIFKQIISSNIEERKKIPGLSKERADIITGGLSPVIMLSRYIDSNRIVFSHRGIRTGILYEYLNQLKKQ